MNFNSLLNNFILPLYKFSLPYINKLPLVKSIFIFVKPYFLTYGYQVLIILNDLKLYILKFIENPKEDETYSIYNFNTKSLITNQDEINKFITSDNSTDYLVNDIIQQYSIKKIVSPIKNNYKSDNICMECNLEINNTLKTYNKEIYPKHLVLSALYLSGDESQDITDLINKYLMGCPEGTKIPLKYILDEEYKPLISSDKDTIKVINSMADELSFGIKDQYLII